MAVGDICKMTIVGELHGQETNNVLHFEFIGTGSTLLDLANAILDCIRTALLPGLTNEWRLIEIRGKMLHPTATDDAFFPALSTDVGAATGEGLPSYCAGLISIKTGKAGRRNRGRMYIPGIPEAGQQTSRLTAGELAVLVAYAQCLVGKFVTTSQNQLYALGVLSRKDMASGVNIINAFKRATVLTTTNVLATQRRRKIGVGS